MTSNEEEEGLNEDDNYSIWIQSIIITALIAAAAIATYYEGFFINRQKLPERAVVVRHTPIYTHKEIPGEGDQHYVDFKLKEGKEFRLTECICLSTRESIVTNLVRGDTLLIRATDKFFSDNEYDVYSITSPQYGAILTTEDTQRCARSLMWWCVVLVFSLASSQSLPPSSNFGTTERNETEQ